MLVENTFKVGDRVVAHDVTGANGAVLELGAVYTVARAYGNLISLEGKMEKFYVDRFQKYPTDTFHNPQPGDRHTLTTQVGGTHYTDMVIQPIEYILANSIPFPEGNVIKYVSRWRAKGGVKDLEKAAHQLRLLIAHEEAKATA